MTKSDIKFRGFIHKHKEMVSFEQLKEWGTNFSAFEDDESIVFEQYTGLKDVNGVEVYEGDIVTCSNGCPHKVIWAEAHGGTIVGGMPGWYFSGLDYGYAWTGEEKIIGNIHENPELLEVE